MRKRTYGVLVAGICLMLAGCQGGQTQETSASETTIEATEETKKEVNLEEVHTAVKEAYGEMYIPSMAYDDQVMNDLFGIGSDLYDSYIGEGPMMSIHVDCFVAIDAKEGKGEEVEELLNAYRTDLVENSMQYPMNVPKVNASEVVRHDDYVFFVMLGTPSDEALESGEEEALASAQENNQIAIDVINGFFQ